MNSIERRKYIEKYLKECKLPVKGSELAKKFNVTRQVIVKDIAISRAEGKNIISTPQGYIIYSISSNTVLRVLPMCHETEQIQGELNTIVKYGGKIIDVIVEHPVYGQMTGMLMIKTMYDVEKFMERLKEYNAEPLLILTAGVHLHTVEAPNEETMEKIMIELKKMNILLLSEDNYDKC